jgi:hypothetical protein
LKLEKGDLLVFYAGLTPFRNRKYKEALYLIGYFTVEKVIDFNKLSKSETENCYRLYPNNAHLKRSYNIKDLVIVVGQKDRSKLLERAILISKTKYNKNGKPYQAVSDEMEKLLGISGSIQRSIPPRFITNENNINDLEHILRL